MNETPGRSRTISGPPESALPFAFVDLVNPTTTDLESVAREYSVDRAFLDHLQEDRISAGVAESEETSQLHLRLDVPSLANDGRMAWDRLDVLCGEEFVVVVQPRPLLAVDRTLEHFISRAGRTTTDFLNYILQELVSAFSGLLTTVDRGGVGNEDARRKGGRGHDASRGKRDRVNELERASARLRKILEDLANGSIQLMTRSSRNKLRVTLDRLEAVETGISRVRERSSSDSAGSSEAENVLGAESPEVIEAAATVGGRRLRRLNLAHAITALVGAFGVSFGALAMAWTGGPWADQIGFERAQLLAALAFPIGFVITLVGKGELFTENFFLPVTGVIRGRGTIRDLLELWGYVLFFNLIGSVIAAFLMSRSGVLDPHAAAFLNHIAQDKISYTFWEAFMKAVFAGWLMTIMTWLILAATGLGTRIVIIWMTGFLIVAGHFNHVVISAPEIFTAMFLGAPITAGDWFMRNFIPALLGNLIGGVVFVTMLGVVQARTLEQSERENAPNDDDDRDARFWTD